MKKLIVLLLLLSMVLTVFVSCKDDTPTPPDNDREQQTGGGEVPLPEPKEEYKDRELAIVYRDTYGYEWEYVEEDAGSVINDAIYERNVSVEDRYGIVLSLMPNANNYDFFVPIDNAILAGDGTYQLVAAYRYRLAPHTVTGNFLDFYQMPSINLDGEWWDRGFTDAASYNNHSYVLSGSLSLSHMYTASCIYFNQDMVNARLAGGSAEIFDKVQNDAWTLSAFYEYVQQFTSDNGDDVWDENDTYGFATNDTTAVDAFLFGSGIDVSRRTDEGKIELIPANEKLVNLTRELHKIINTSGHTYNQSTSTVEGLSVHIGMILRGNAAFSTGVLENASDLRTTEINYGILPYPKWDEEQDNYYSITMDYSSAFAVPRTIEDEEFVGTMVEALAYYSHIYVRDALYDTVLKYRDAKDADSSKCVDIILENIKYDFAYIYAFEWGDQQGPSALLRTCIRGKQTYIANGYKSNQERYNTVLTAFLKKFI